MLVRERIGVQRLISTVVLSIKNCGWLGRKKRKKELVGNNLETTAIHHFLEVTASLESLEVNGGAAVTTSGNKAMLQISTDCLSSLSSFYGSIKHLQIIHIVSSQSGSLDLSAFKNLKILSLGPYILIGVERGQLGSLLVSGVEVLHLPFFRFL